MNAEELLHHITNKYSNEDKDLFHSLINYCYDLQTEIKKLKEEHTLELLSLEHNHKKHSSHASQKIVDKKKTFGTAQESKETNLSAVVEKIENKLSHIRQLFSSADPLTLRHEAAIKIQSIIRTRFIRKKFIKLQRSIQTWQSVESETVISLCMDMISKLTLQKNAIVLFRFKYNSKVLIKFFRVWKAITNVSAPKRRAALKIVDIKAKEKSVQLMMKVCI
jgi:hypothetical protein